MESKQKERLLAALKMLTKQTSKKKRYQWLMKTCDALELLVTVYKSKCERRGYTCKETPMELQKLAKWITIDGNLKNGLVINGGIGCGKTTAARSIIEVSNRLTYINELVEEVEGCKIIRNGGILPLSEEQVVIHEYAAVEVARLANHNIAAFEAVKKCARLYIDDLGCEPTEVKNYGSEWSPLVELIDYRNDMQLFTIITTNLSMVDLAKRYGERTASRLNELCNVVTFKGEDKRKIHI